MHALKFLSHPLQRTAVLSARGFSSENSGIRVIEKPDSNSPIASFGLYIARGARHEPRDLLGVTHLLKHLVYKSSNTRLQIQVCRDLEVLGAHFSATASREYLFLYTSLPKNPANEQYLVNHLFDVIQPKLAAPWEVRELSSVLEEETKEAESNIYKMISENLHKYGYSHYGLGNPLYSGRNLENIANHEKVLQWMKSITQSELIFVHSGASDPEHINKFAASAGSTFSTETAPKVRAIYTPAYDHRVQLGGNELHHVVAYEGVGFTHPDYLSFAVLEKVLGSFGFSDEVANTNLGRAASVKQKYPFATALTPINFNYSDSGIFGFYTRSPTQPEQLEFLQHFAPLMLAQIVKFGVSEQTLEHAKHLVLTSHLLQLEDKETFLKATAQDTLYNSNLASLSPALASVTTDSIKKAAERLLVSRPGYLNYGNVSLIPSARSLDKFSKLD